MTLAEWIAEGVTKFGPDRTKWVFVCPSCGHLATQMDWLEAGAPPNTVAFSCIGRYLPDAGAEQRTFKQNGGPCNYAGGGLLRLNPTLISMPDGAQVNLFAFADPTQVTT